MSQPPFPSSRRGVLLGGAAAGAAALEIVSDLGVTAVQANPATPDAHPFKTHGPAPKTSAPIHTVRQLTAEIATPESFAPFGKVLGESGRKRLPINTYGDKLDLYRESFESDQPIEWFIVHAHARRREVLFLERHLQLTQTFIPLGGKPFYTIVARAGAREENGFPALEEIKAFLVPGDVAIQVDRGTWHENPMPAEDRARLLVTSHAALTLAHQQNPAPKLKALPLDLERRWYKAGGYDLTIA